MEASTEIQPTVATTVVRRDAQALVDITVGAAASAAHVSGAVGRRVMAVASPIVGPVAGLALRPPLVSEAYQPVTWLTRLAREGQVRRAAMTVEASHLLDVVVPVVVAAMLERLDLTDMVQRNVDLDEIINTVDLAALTETVMAEVDLPEIIRQSTGSLTSDTVRGVRMQGISADEAVGRAVSRFRRRRKAPPAEQPPVASPSVEASPTVVTPPP